MQETMEKIKRENEATSAGALPKHQSVGEASPLTGAMTPAVDARRLASHGDCRGMNSGTTLQVGEVDILKSQPPPSPIF